jgi:hypothetical protein
MSRHDFPLSKVQIDMALVRRLIAAQFPQWAGLAIAPVVRARRTSRAA